MSAIAIVAVVIVGLAMLFGLAIYAIIPDDDEIF